LAFWSRVIGFLKYIIINLDPIYVCFQQELQFLLQFWSLLFCKHATSKQLHREQRPQVISLGTRNLFLSENF
jgi:hypothetical protein